MVISCNFTRTFIIRIKIWFDEKQSPNIMVWSNNIAMKKVRYHVEHKY